MLVDQSTREKDRRATRLLRVAGDRHEVHVRVGGHGPWWVAGASVQPSERGVKIEQATRYCRDGVDVQLPAVHTGGGWQNHATATAAGGDEEGA